MPDRIQHFVPVGAYIGSTITAISALWTWIGTNQPQLTALCSLFGLAIAVCSFIRQLKNTPKRRK